MVWRSPATSTSTSWLRRRGGAPRRRLRGPERHPDANAGSNSGYDAGTQPYRAGHMRPHRAGRTQPYRAGRIRTHRAGCTRPHRAAHATAPRQTVRDDAPDAAAPGPAAAVAGAEADDHPPPRHLGGDYVVGGYDNEVMRGRTGQGGGCTGRDGSRLGGTGTVRDRAGTGRDGPGRAAARKGPAMNMNTGLLNAAPASSKARDRAELARAALARAALDRAGTVIQVCTE